MSQFIFNYQGKTNKAKYEIIYGKGDPFCIVRMNDKLLPEVLTMRYDPNNDSFSWDTQETEERAELLEAIAKGVNESMSEAKGGHPLG